MKAVKEIVRKYYKYESWTQPVLSSNGTIGVDDFAVSCSLPALTGDPYPRSLYLAFDGIIGNAENRFQSVSNTTNPQYIIVYSKNSLNIKSITFYQMTQETYYYIKAITIQGSNNGSDWTDLQTWTSNSYVANFTVDLSSNLEYYNYYRFYITNRAYYDSSNAYLMIQEISMTGTQAVESTESDYDFYVDKDIYKAVKETVRKYYKYGNTPNVNIVGNPTISNGVASNFSNTNYLTLPTAFQPAANPWVNVLKVNMNNNGATGVFLGNTSSGYFRLGFNNTNIVTLYLSTNSTSFNIGQLIGTTAMVNGVDYWVKATFDGTKYQIFLSTDGESYNLEGTLNSSSIPAYQSLSTLGAGNNSNNSTPQYTQGSIDLKNSYIKINDKEFWHGTLLEESTESDYDFYKDVDVYKIVKTE